MSSPLEQGRDVKAQSPIFVQSDEDDTNPNGDAESQPDDEDEMLIQFDNSKLFYAPGKMWEAIREHYACALEAVAKEVKPTNKLHGRLEDAASFVRTTDIPTFLKKHKDIWLEYVRAALKEVNMQEENMKKLLEGINRPKWHRLFKRHILQDASDIRERVEKNRDLINNLLRDLRPLKPEDN